MADRHISDPLPRRLAGRLVMPGHVGIVYQALGFRYTGRGTGRTLTLLPDGSALPARSAQKVRRIEPGAFGVVQRLVRLGASPMGRDGQRDPARWLAEALDQVGARKVRHRGNHRYVVPIGDRAARRQVGIGLEARPFPKRADPAEGELPPAAHRLGGSGHDQRAAAGDVTVPAPSPRPCALRQWWNSRPGHGPGRPRRRSGGDRAGSG
jgi:hypothetical protein